MYSGCFRISFQRVSSGSHYWITVFISCQFLTYIEWALKWPALCVVYLWMGCPSSLLDFGLFWLVLFSATISLCVHQALLVSHCYPQRQLHWRLLFSVWEIKTQGHIFTACLSKPDVGYKVFTAKPCVYSFCPQYRGSTYLWGRLEYSWAVP